MNILSLHLVFMLCVPSYINGMEGTKNKKTIVKKVKKNIVVSAPVVADEDVDNNENPLPELQTQLEVTDAIKIPNAFFSPHIKDVLIKLISEEKASIKAACYRFTLFPVAEALVASQDFFVKVEVVVNKDYDRDLCFTLRHLISNGINVNAIMKNKSSEFDFDDMHHKFIICEKNQFDKPVLITGSFNVTGNAHQRNWENIVLIDDIDTIQRYKEEFASLIEMSRELKETDCKSVSTPSKSGKTESPDQKPSSYFINEVPLKYLASGVTKNEYGDFIGKAIYFGPKDLQKIKKELGEEANAKQKRLMQRTAGLLVRKIELAKQLQ